MSLFNIKIFICFINLKKRYFYETKRILKFINKPIAIIKYFLTKSTTQIKC